MHPRNIFKKGLDFKELAKEFPEIKEHTTLNLKGKVKFNFKNPEALRALSRTLLKKHFDLDVNFPINTLVPTIPLRLNYILFIEDILKANNIHDNIKGIDIGTGASCVYPLLGVKKNGWFMVGTEINTDSIECAQRNVAANKLENLIEVMQVTEGEVLSDVLNRDTSNYDFCMCNPPFFRDVRQATSPQNRTANRSEPNNAFTGECHEIVTDGGEVSFVRKIINESLIFRDRIRVFTSMVGIKGNMQELLSTIRDMNEIKSYMKTTFSQGHTKRYGIAWTFDENVSFEEIGKEKKIPEAVRPYTHLMPYDGGISLVETKLKEMFDKLELKHILIKKDDRSLQYNLVANTNTWSHFRRKRRAQINELKAETSEDATNENNKRNIKDLEDNKAKKPKTECDEELQAKLLECTVSASITEPGLLMAFVYVGGTGANDATHQLCQFFRNHFKL